MKEFLVIGEICKPHGVKGEVKVFSLTDNLSRFKELESVLINNKEYAIESCKLQSDRVILKLEGVNSMDEAERFRNAKIMVNREHGIELDEDSYYIADLIDCKVFDENRLYIGVLEEVIETGSNDVYLVKDDKKKEILVPAIASIVKSVDIKNEEIVILPVEEWM
ncbi:16S rRNA processing protein RimM [Hathewaya proteolytica DSM 3090]|uniref:Ribosome maturation factor RimM n=1 Tax=Hathewaya proteolytica DSM 3090 TaxID=1121331 RepID=A0A1M6J7W9_9CLOT|nr:ribosome maturation factor RimM [Hathewaya proteolytica]SHJ42788.1 16S rRNA processing protein RimM [Hathewaya proteolytica DSM 3090]